MLAAAVFLGSLAAGALYMLAGRNLLSHPVLARKNYAGREVPTSAGILFAAVYLPVYVVVRIFENSGEASSFGPRESLLVLVIGMCFVGLIDDVLGDRGSRGFRGHLGAALKGRLTTGLFKAFAGFLIAMAASFPFSRHLWEVVLNAALIALCANIFNLLDIRPGRACKIFFPAFAATVALTWGLGNAFIPYALSCCAVALLLFPGDLSEKYMLGDAGSNVLGATVGLGLALGTGAWWRLGLTIFLIILTLLSEKFSFSAIIESNRVLNRLDNLGRKGQNVPGANY